MSVIMWAVRRDGVRDDEADETPYRCVAPYECEETYAEESAQVSFRVRECKVVSRPQ